MANKSYTATMLVETHHRFGSIFTEIVGIRKKMEFQQVVLEGIQAMQRFQKAFAPVGTTGPGPHGRIPRSIQAARLRKTFLGNWVGVSRTVYPPAIFTNEGTGKYGSNNRPYFVPHSDGQQGGYMHPGMRGTGWWERGANMGSPIALAAFQRKVERALGLRG